MVAHEKIKEFFLSGASALPYYPNMSAVAWVESGRLRRPKITTCDRTTTSEIAFFALLGLLHYVSEDSRVQICTDSRLVSYKFKQICEAKSRDLHDPFWRARTMLERKGLSVELRMVSRTQNPARKLLDEFKVALRQERRRREW